MNLAGCSTQQIYKTPHLWWLIALVNDIIDPVEDMYLGQELIIPSHIDYYQDYIRYKKADDIQDVFERRKLKL